MIHADILFLLGQWISIAVSAVPAAPQPLKLGGKIHRFQLSRTRVESWDGSQQRHNDYTFPDLSARPEPVRTLQWRRLNRAGAAQENFLLSRRERGPRASLVCDPAALEHALVLTTNGAAIGWAQGPARFGDVNRYFRCSPLTFRLPPTNRRG